MFIQTSQRSSSSRPQPGPDLRCEDCGNGFQSKDAYDRHRDRREEKGVCLGHIPDGALTTMHQDGAIVVLVSGTMPASDPPDLDGPDPAIVDDVGWWS